MRGLRFAFSVTAMWVAGSWGAASSDALAQVPAFVDAAEAAGLDASHQPDSVVTGNHARQTGGAAAGDFDRDGFTDLFVVSGGAQPDHLFINQGDGTFVDEALAWGLVDMHAGNGVAVADVDGDGLLDVYVSSFGPIVKESMGAPGNNRLYRNVGGAFVEEGVARGVAWASAVEANAYGAAFGDYDLDGDLDLFVASWSIDGEGNRLYRNRGDGVFDDVTSSAILPEDLEGVWGFQPTFADIDGDLWPELLLVADFKTSRFFLNRRDGTFENANAAWRAGLDENGMGNAVADFNNDGALDWYVTSIFQDAQDRGHNGSMLYINRGWYFTEVSRWTRVADGGWGWGALAVDFEHDGRLDIVATEGREAVGGEWEDEPTKLFHQGDRLRFDERALDYGLDHRGSGRAIVGLDAELDGDVDVVITTNAAPLAYFRNEASDPGHWLRVALDTSGNPSLPPDGYGARVEVLAGGQRHTGYMHGAPSFLATSELALHFGLGDAAVVDEVRITWSRGYVTTLTTLAADQTLLVMAPALCDINVDGLVDSVDLAEIAARFGLANDPARVVADINLDGLVDAADQSACGG
jgi:hypothetical protein